MLFLQVIKVHEKPEPMITFGQEIKNFQSNL